MEKKHIVSLVNHCLLLLEIIWMKKNYDDSCWELEIKQYNFVVGGNITKFLA